MKVTVDYSPRSTVWVCACGARDVATTRTIALRAAADHHAAVHTDESKQTGKLRDKARGTRRHAEIVTAAHKTG